ncbi:MAG TPA: MlaD family protein, partial [bacterium]|nr:MlaD family protein [bacterium]
RFTRPSSPPLSEIGAPVRLAGFHVGEVTGIELIPGQRRAQVKIMLSEKYRLPEGSRARIDTSGIMGEKYIELSFGPGPGFYLPNDIIEGEEPFKMEDVVNKGQAIADEVRTLVGSLNLILGEETTRTSLHALVKNLENLTANLDAVVGGERQNIHTIMSELTQASQNLSSALIQAESAMFTLGGLVEENRDEVQKTIENVKDFSDGLRNRGDDILVRFDSALRRIDSVGQNLDRLTTQLNGLVGDSSPQVQEIVTSVKDSSRNLQEASGSAKRMLKDLEDGRGVMGRLLRDEALGEKTERTLNQVSDTVNAWHNTLSSASLRYRFRGYRDREGLGLDEDSSNRWRNDLTLGLNLGERNFLEVGGNDIGGDNDLELMFGRRFDRLSLRAGVKDSEAAIGVDWLLIRDWFELSAEGIGLTDRREERLDLIGRLSVHDHVSIIGGVQDVGEGNNANLGLELRY